MNEIKQNFTFFLFFSCPSVQEGVICFEINCLQLACVGYPPCRLDVVGFIWVRGRGPLTRLLQILIMNHVHWMGSIYDDSYLLPPSNAVVIF